MANLPAHIPSTYSLLMPESYRFCRCKKKAPDPLLPARCYQPVRYLRFATRYGLA